VEVPGDSTKAHEIVGLLECFCVSLVAGAGFEPATFGL
jgi:hypothetical protein